MSKHLEAGIQLQEDFASSAPEAAPVVHSQILQNDIAT